jgi:hypothetical protein
MHFPGDIVGGHFRSGVGRMDGIQDGRDYAMSEDKDRVTGTDREFFAVFNHRNVNHYLTEQELKDFINRLRRLQAKLRKAQHQVKDKQNVR